MNRASTTIIMAPRERNHQQQQHDDTSSHRVVVSSASRSVTPQRIASSTSHDMQSAVPPTTPSARRTLNENSYRQHTFRIQSEPTEEAMEDDDATPTTEKSTDLSMVPTGSSARGGSRNKKGGTSKTSSPTEGGSSKKSKKKRIEYFDLYLKHKGGGDDNTVSDLSAGDFAIPDDDTLGALSKSSLLGRMKQGEGNENELDNHPIIQLDTVVEIPANKSKLISSSSSLEGGHRSCEQQEPTSTEAVEETSSNTKTARHVRRKGDHNETVLMDKSSSSSSHRRRTNKSSAGSTGRSTPSRSAASAKRSTPSKRAKKRRDENSSGGGKPTTTTTTTTRLRPSSNKAATALDTMQALDRALDITRERPASASPTPPSLYKNDMVVGDQELPLPSSSSRRKARRTENSKSRTSDVEQLIRRLPMQPPPDHLLQRPSRSLGRRHSSTGEIEIRNTNGQAHRFDHSWRSEDNTRTTSRQNASWDHRDINMYQQQHAAATEAAEQQVDAFARGIAFFKLHVEAQKKKPIVRRRRSFVGNVSPGDVLVIDTTDSSRQSRRRRNSCGGSSGGSSRSCDTSEYNSSTKSGLNRSASKDHETADQRRRARHHDFRLKAEEIISEWEVESRRNDRRRRAQRLSEGDGGEWDL